MVAQRESIAKLGIPLAEMVISGGANTKEAVQLAIKLQRLCATVGTYTKQYETHEERVLHRHLNLYKNKLAKARTDTERARWIGKIAEQEEKIRLSRSGTDDLDLDGL